MKRIKTFEMWTTDISSDIEVNYGDKPKKSKYSEIVIQTKNYINDNFGEIHNILSYESIGVVFKRNSTTEYLSIKIEDYKDDDNLYKIIFMDRHNKNNEIFITRKEFRHLKKFINKLKYRLNKLKYEDDEDEVLNNIVPIKRDIKKYNL